MFFANALLVATSPSPNIHRNRPHLKLSRHLQDHSLGGKFITGRVTTPNVATFGEEVQLAK